jgi:hypothetical protein
LFTQQLFASQNSFSYTLKKEVLSVAMQICCPSALLYTGELITRIVIQVTTFKMENKDLLDVEENTEGVVENVGKL